MMNFDVPCVHALPAHEKRPVPLDLFEMSSRSECEAFLGKILAMFVDLDLTADEMSRASGIPFGIITNGLTHLEKRRS